MTSVQMLGLIALVAHATAAAPASAERRRAGLVTYGTAAQSLEPTLRTALRKLSTISLKDEKATAADLASAAQLGATCEAAMIDCQVKLAVFMNVDVLVVASAESRADGASLELVAVDASLAREVAREAVVVPRGETRDEMLSDVTELLLEPDLHFGALVVTASTPGAKLSVDGGAPSPLAAEGARLRVRAGRHRVDVTAAGSQPFHAEPAVQPGQETRVRAELAPAAPVVVARPAPSVSLPVIVSLSALGAAAVAAGGAVAVDAGLGAGLGSFDQKPAVQTAGVALLVVAGFAGVVAAIAGGVALTDALSGDASAAR